MADTTRTTRSTSEVSTPQELARAAFVTTSGAPSHTPEVAAQKCVDTATGIVYEWWGAAWHPATS